MFPSFLPGVPELELGAWSYNGNNEGTWPLGSCADERHKRVWFNRSLQGPEAHERSFLAIGLFSVSDFSLYSNSFFCIPFRVKGGWE